MAEIERISVGCRAMCVGMERLTADRRLPVARTVSDGRACGAIRRATSGAICTTRALTPR